MRRKLIRPKDKLPVREFLRDTHETYSPHELCAYARDILVTFGEEGTDYSRDSAPTIQHAEWP